MDGKAVTRSASVWRHLSNKGKQEVGKKHLEEVRELLPLNLSAQEMAARLGVHKDTIYVLLRKITGWNLRARKALDMDRSMWENFCEYMRANPYYFYDTFGIQPTVVNIRKAYQTSIRGAR